MKKTFAVSVMTLLLIFVVMGCSKLPSWAPKNPSPEFVRAARVLKPLPPVNHAVGLLDIPIWESFGALTDQQLNDFMKIQQVRLKTGIMPQQAISKMKKDYGATEERGYIVYDTRRISIPVKAMSAVQRRAFDKVAEASRSELMKLGANQDMSNVSLDFDANGGHVMWVSFEVKVQVPTGSIGTNLSLGPFGYIR